jgi:glycosyltransferase involved in cell wall biosynthesis
VSVHRPQRVALVIGQLTRGGAEGQLAQLLRGVDRARFEPVVYCLSTHTEPVGREIAAAGVPLRVLTGGALRRSRLLAWHFDADRIDLVHSWLYLGNAMAGAAHLWRPSRPLITSARNCKIQGRFSQFANVVAFRSSRAIVVNSRDVAAYITRTYAAPRARIRVIYNGIDIERFHPETAGEAVGPIVTIGRLVDQKNHDLFLRAAAMLSRDVPDARFTIVGDGPLRATLEAQARALGLADRVSFTGERGDVEAILRTASLFWLTSRWEGMPNVVLEAMASGVPVVATDVGGARELVRDGIDGFVVGPNDAAAFVRHSRAMLGDAGRRCACATAARVHAEMLSTPRMIAAMAQLYEEVLS